MGLLLCVCCNVYLVQCVCKSRRICGTHSCEEFLRKDLMPTETCPLQSALCSNCACALRQDSLSCILPLSLI